jgi:hypothetical protein
MTARFRDKQSARNATKAAQAGAVVLIVVVSGVAAFGLPGLKVEEVRVAPPVEDQGPDSPQPRPGAQAEPAADTMLIAENLGYLGNVPTPPEPVEVADAGDSGPEIPEESPGREVRYVGSIISGDRASALLNIGGVSRVLRPGQVYEGVELLEVGPAEVVISIDGADARRVEKSERQGPSVLVATGGAPPPPTPEQQMRAIAGEQPGTAREITPDMSREERRAVLMERAERARNERWRRERDD